MNTFLYPFYPPVFYPPYFYNAPRQLRTFKVVVQAISDSGAITDLRIDERIFRMLPNECLLLFITQQGIVPGRVSNDVNVVAGNRRLSVTDSQGEILTGADLTEPTEKQVYLNKRDNIFRVVNYTAVTGTP